MSLRFLVILKLVRMVPLLVRTRRPIGLLSGKLVTGSFQVVILVWFFLPVTRFWRRRCLTLFQSRSVLAVNGQRFQWTLPRVTVKFSRNLARRPRWLLPLRLSSWVWTVVLFSFIKLVNVVLTILVLLLLFPRRTRTLIIKLIMFARAMGELLSFLLELLKLKFLLLVNFGTIV